jgi:hypothetical protein
MTARQLSGGEAVGSAGREVASELGEAPGPARRGGGSEKGGLHGGRGGNITGEAAVTYRRTKGSRGADEMQGGWEPFHRRSQLGEDGTARARGRTHCQHAAAERQSVHVAQ